MNKLKNIVLDYSQASIRNIDIWKLKLTVEEVIFTNFRKVVSKKLSKMILDMESKLLRIKKQIKIQLYWKKVLSIISLLVMMPELDMVI